MTNLRGRLARLESGALRPVSFYRWAKPGESNAAAVARHFPEGLPEGARLVLLSWTRSHTLAPPEGESAFGARRPM